MVSISGSVFLTRDRMVCNGRCRPWTYLALLHVWSDCCSFRGWPCHHRSFHSPGILAGAAALVGAASLRGKGLLRNLFVSSIREWRRGAGSSPEGKRKCPRPTRGLFLSAGRVYLSGRTSLQVCGN